MNSIWLDVKYFNLLSSQLQLVKKTNDHAWAFRCPICGDSKKSTTKTRGYCYKKGNSLVVHCHNCGYHRMFGNFLKQLDYSLFEQYRMDRLVEGQGRSNTTLATSLTPLIEEESACVQPSDQLEDTCLLDKLFDRIDRLPPDNIAVKYCQDRKIGREHWNKLYYIDDCQKISNIRPKYKNALHGEPRLIFPIYNIANKLCAFQTRILVDDPNLLRYMLIKLDDNENLIYNIENVNVNKTIYVVEGPVDCLMLPNSVSALNSDLVGKIEKLFIYNKKLIDNCVFIFDNQPKNKEVVKMINKAVVKGYKTFIWPTNITEKDLNVLVTDGKYTHGELLELVNTHTYQQLRAKLAFTAWKKI